MKIDLIERVSINQPEFVIVGSIIRVERNGPPEIFSVRPAAKPCCDSDLGYLKGEHRSRDSDHKNQ